MAVTAREMYDAVNQSILDLLAGNQEARFNGRTYRKADLDDLRKMRQDLAAEVAVEEGGPRFRVRQVVPRG